MKFLFIQRLDRHMREVVHGASLGFAIKVFGAGMSFGFNILVAQILGAGSSGIYYLALTVSTIASTFSRFGLEYTLLRFTAARAAVGDWKAVTGLHQKSMRLCLAASIFSTLIVFVAAPWLAEIVFSKPYMTQPLRLISLAIIPVSISALQAQMLQGLKRITDSLLIIDVTIPGFGIVGLYSLSKNWGANGAVGSYILASILTLIVASRLWHKATPQLQKLKGYFDTQELLHSSMPLLWVSLINLLLTYASTFMLGIWGTTSEVGIFGVVSRISLLINLIIVAVTSIAGPKFAELYIQKDQQALRALAKNSTKLMTYLGLPILLLFFIAPTAILRIFGSEFTLGATALRILSVGQLVNLVTGATAYLLMMTGHEKIYREKTTLIAVFNIILNIVLINIYGIDGAAIATSLSTISLNLLLLNSVHKHLGILTI